MKVKRAKVIKLVKIEKMKKITRIKRRTLNLFSLLALITLFSCGQNKTGPSQRNLPYSKKGQNASPSEEDFGGNLFYKLAHGKNSHPALAKILARDFKGKLKEKKLSCGSKTCFQEIGLESLSRHLEKRSLFYSFHRRNIIFKKGAYFKFSGLLENSLLTQFREDSGKEQFFSSDKEYYLALLSKEKRAMLKDIQSTTLSQIKLNASFLASSFLKEILPLAPSLGDELIRNSKIKKKEDYINWVSHQKEIKDIFQRNMVTMEREIDSFLGKKSNLRKKRRQRQILLILKEVISQEIYNKARNNFISLKYKADSKEIEKKKLIHGMKEIYILLKAMISFQEDIFSKMEALLLSLQSEIDLIEEILFELKTFFPKESSEEDREEYLKLLYLKILRGEDSPFPKRENLPDSLQEKLSLLKKYKEDAFFSSQKLMNREESFFQSTLLSAQSIGLDLSSEILNMTLKGQRRGKRISLLLKRLKEERGGEILEGVWKLTSFQFSHFFGLDVEIMQNDISRILGMRKEEGHFDPIRERQREILHNRIRLKKRLEEVTALVDQTYKEMYKEKKGDSSSLLPFQFPLKFDIKKCEELTDSILYGKGSENLKKKNLSENLLLFIDKVSSFQQKISGFQNINFLREERRDLFDSCQDALEEVFLFSEGKIKTLPFLIPLRDSQSYEKYKKDLFQNLKKKELSLKNSLIHIPTLLRYINSLVVFLPYFEINFHKRTHSARDLAMDQLLNPSTKGFKMMKRAISLLQSSISQEILFSGMGELNFPLRQERKISFKRNKLFIKNKLTFFLYHKFKKGPFLKEKYLKILSKKERFSSFLEAKESENFRELQEILGENFKIVLNSQGEFAISLFFNSNDEEVQTMVSLPSEERLERGVLRYSYQMHKLIGVHRKINDFIMDFMPQNYRTKEEEIDGDVLLQGVF